MRLAFYAFRRLIEALPVFVAVVSLVFVLINLAPGNAALVLGGESASPDLVAALTVKYGLDKPLAERWWRYLKAAGTGDFGYSLVYQESVVSVIASRIGPTLLLILAAQVVGLILGIGFGFLTAIRQGSKIDTVVSYGAAVLFALPLFWLGLMAIIIFSVGLNLFPTGGMSSVRIPPVGLAKVGDLASHLFLPAMTLGIGWFFPQYFRITRVSLIEQLGEDYVRTARAKGLSPLRILHHHVFRNASIPIVTVAGIWLSLSFSGAVLTETVFSWPGLGRLMYDSIFSRDFPVLVGVFIITAGTVLLFGLLMDLLYVALDPRISRG